MSEIEIQPRELAPDDVIEAAPAPSGMTATPIAFEDVKPAVICPTCKHTAQFDGDAAKEIVVCNECGTRLAFGVAQPRVVIEPNGPFVMLRLSGVAIRTKSGERVELADLMIDRQLAKQIAMNIISIT